MPPATSSAAPILIRRAPKGFAIYSGDDATALALMLMGGDGVISVTANVAPRLMHEMCGAAFAGDLVKARSLNNKLLGLHRHLFVEANPIPVKWVLQEMGMIRGGIRLPLTPLSSSFHDLLRGAMEQAGIAARMPVPERGPEREQHESAFTPTRLRGLGALLMRLLGPREQEDRLQIGEPSRRGRWKSRRILSRPMRATA